MDAWSFLDGALAAYLSIIVWHLGSLIRKRVAYRRRLRMRAELFRRWGIIDTREPD